MTNNKNRLTEVSGKVTIISHYRANPTFVGIDSGAETYCCFFRDENIIKYIYDFIDRGDQVEIAGAWNKDKTYINGKEIRKI